MPTLTTTPDKRINPQRDHGKTTSLQSLLQPDTKEYRTTAADREERMKERQKTEMEDTEVSESLEQRENSGGRSGDG